MILTLLIMAYRLLPFRPNCPRAGLSCSALGLACAKAGGSLTDIKQIIRECGTGPCDGPSDPAEWCCWQYSRPGS